MKIFINYNHKTIVDTSTLQLTNNYELTMKYLFRYLYVHDQEIIKRRRIQHNSYCNRNQIHYSILLDPTIFLIEISTLARKHRFQLKNGFLIYFNRRGFQNKNHIPIIGGIQFTQIELDNQIFLMFDNIVRTFTNIQ